jgi:hypothetical protein
MPDRNPKPRVMKAFGVWFVLVGTRSNIRRTWREAADLAVTIAGGHRV